MSVQLDLVQTTDPAGASLSAVDLSPAQVLQSVFRILQTNVLCSMATVTPAGQAHINTAYFSYSDDLELVFLSHPASLHCRNISANSSMAMAVFSSAQKWGGPDQGLQFFGACHPAAESLPAQEVYVNRFPGYRIWYQELGAEDPGREYRFYRFLPSQVKVFDETGLGGGLFVQANIMR